MDLDVDNGEKDVLCEKIINDINAVFLKDNDLSSFEIIPTQMNCNKSPVVHVDHNLGLESWCAKHVYDYAHKALLAQRQQNQQQPQRYLQQSDLLVKYLNVALLISPDVTTFWHIRRQLVQKNRLKINQEFQFSALILTKKPKSNEAFAYRRWLFSFQTLNMVDRSTENELLPPDSHYHKSSESLCFGGARKKLHRSAHINEVYRPRCNTDPGTKPDGKLLKIPLLTIPTGVDENIQVPTAQNRRRKHHVAGGGLNTLSSLIEQTLKVTTATVGLQTAGEKRLTQHHSNEEVKRRFSRSTSSVSTLAYATPDTSMAPLQSHIEAQSVTCLNTLDKDTTTTSPTQSEQSTTTAKTTKRQLSTPGSINSGYSSANSSVNENYPNLSSLSNAKSETRSLKNHSSSSLNPLVPVASSVSLRSISPSRKSASSSNSSNTAKHEQSSAAAAASTPPEKEKKRKEVSSSRVKKFHRHFSQVSKDEKLINYFSCALVSDILLQGHLYITDQHFAFYSNVFGYVTKVVIPTSSVTKISKEKTAKIIPNAVGVATAEERHVFGSFISREAAFRLMCSVCPPLLPIEIINKIPAELEISEEYSIEDDSSCSISGNESPQQTLEAGAAGGVAVPGENGQTMMRRAVAGSSLSIAEGKTADKMRHSDGTANGSSSSAFPRHPNVGIRASAPPAAHYNNLNNSTSKSSPSPTPPPNTKANIQASLLSTPTTGAAASAATNLTMIIAGNASSSTSVSSSPTPSTASLPTTMVATPAKSAAKAAADSFKALTKNALLRLKFPTQLHVVYLGVLLSLILALFSVFLLYRILDIEAKAGMYRSPVEFNWRSGDDEDIFAEALRWQKELQTKSTEEAQSILTTNLEQIAKVRRSLETLSMLIHDRSSAYETTNRDDSD